MGKNGRGWWGTGRIRESKKCDLVLEKRLFLFWIKCLKIEKKHWFSQWVQFSFSNRYELLIIKYGPLLNISMLISQMVISTLQSMDTHYISMNLWKNYRNEGLFSLNQNNQLWRVVKNCQKRMFPIYMWCSCQLLYIILF